MGPGNQFVAEAKKQVFGQVGIDMVAGPSEILVIADGKCRPEIVAADLLSQAEHDPNASAVLVTDSAALAEAVQAAVEEQLPKLLRKDIARASIDRNGKIIVAQSLDAAVEIANEIAPEHLELCVEQPLTTWTRFRTRGLSFWGATARRPWGLLRRAQPHPAHQRHRPVLQPAVCGRFCKEDAVYLLYQEGPGEGPDVRVQLCQEGGASPATPAAWTSGLTPPLPRRPHEPIFAHQVRGPGDVYSESSPGTSSTSNSTPTSPPIPPPRRFWRPWARGGGGPAALLRPRGDWVAGEAGGAVRRDAGPGLSVQWVGRHFELRVHGLWGERRGISFPDVQFLPCVCQPPSGAL